MLTFAGQVADCSKFVDWQLRGQASVSEAVVHMWYCAHVVKGRPEGPSVAFRDEMHIISQVGRHLTTQCLAHQTGVFDWIGLSRV